MVFFALKILQYFACIISLKITKFLIPLFAFRFRCLCPFYQLILVVLGYNLPVISSWQKIVETRQFFNAIRH